MESCCSTGESLGGCVNNCVVTDKAAEFFVGYVFFSPGTVSEVFCFYFGTWTLIVRLTV